MNTHTSSIAALSRAGRAILGWSQADLAKKTGMATTSLARIETGGINPRYDSVMGIIQAIQQGGLEITYDISGEFTIRAPQAFFQDS
jgi:predicted transcriptional regulator